MFLKIFLLIALILGQMYPSTAAVKTGDKCAKVGIIAKSKGKNYLCTKSGKVNRWAERKPSAPLSVTPTVEPPAPIEQPAVPSTKDEAEQLLISTVPQGGFNTSFMLGKPQSRDVGQTLFFESDVKLSSIEFEIAAFTWISPEYHFASEDQKHNLEKPYNRGEYKPFPANINVSLWKDDREILGTLPPTFDLKNGFTQVEEFDVNTKIDLGRSVRIAFPKPAAIKAGYYYLNLYFVVDDLNITTLRFAGRQTGNNTMGGPNRDMPTSCSYTPSKDLYPKGQAYYSYQDNSWDKKTPEEKWNYQTPRSYTFKLHDYAKVTDCIVIGSYNDILNTGDIFLNVYVSKP